MLVIALGLCSATAWGVADFLGGMANRRAPLLAIGIGSQAVGALVGTVIVCATGAHLPPGDAVGYAALAGAANAVGLAAFYRGLAVGTMSIVAPIVGMSALLPVTVGVLGGERPGPQHVAGIALAIAGIVLASREPPGGAAARRAARASIVLAVAAAIGVGGNLAALDAAVHRAAAEDLWGLLVVTRGVAGALLLTAALVTRRRMTVPAGAGRAVLALGILDLAANVFYGIATHDGLVSLVAVLASLHPVVTVLLAALILREHLVLSQRAGVALALVGAMLISAT
ncbi:MAG: hypothetical protein QOE86_273 [Solirubrobacteraceae bacterium]|nr:hypothetical protein [Solirubrobacteraceae bacterium]